MRWLAVLFALLAGCAPLVKPDPPARAELERSGAPVAPPAVSQPAMLTLAVVDPPLDEASDDPPLAEVAPPLAGHADEPVVRERLQPLRQHPPVSFVGSGVSGPKRVGLQVGHWGNEHLPPELERLKVSGSGAVGGGYTEVQVAYDLAVRTAGLLYAHGLVVDILPATVPVDYRADVFVAIHTDGDPRGALRGFKIARSPLSMIPEHDDVLVQWLYAEYARATGLPRDDDHITPQMLYYYAFNNRRHYHAIAPSTPAAIVETGFLTSAADRELLVGQPDRVAAGLAAGILGFLGLKP